MIYLLDSMLDRTSYISSRPTVNSINHLSHLSRATFTKEAARDPPSLSLSPLSSNCYLHLPSLTY